MAFSPGDCSLIGCLVVVCIIFLAAVDLLSSLALGIAGHDDQTKTESVSNDRNTEIA